MDLRHLALILNEGKIAADQIQDAVLAHTLNAMTETAVYLHQHPDGELWNVERDFAQLAERLS